MLKTLRAIFETRIADFLDEPEATHSLELASAALLLEISRADHDVADVEKAAIRDAIGAVYHLAPDEVEDLLSAASAAVETAVSLYDFTAILNERFSPDQKRRLMEMLWAVAYADEHLDHYEEYYVRKVADLLHISHEDYIRTKLKAAPG